MEIKIRDVDVRAVKVLDDEARKQGISRNILLKRLIEDTVTFHGIKEMEKELDDTLNRVAHGLQVTFNRLDYVEKRTFKLYFLLCDALGLDPKEVEHYFAETMNMKNEEGDSFWRKDKGHFSG